MTFEEAEGLSDRIGGKVHHAGGGIHVVIVPMADGKVMVVSEGYICVYDDERAFLNGNPEIWGAING